MPIERLSLRGSASGGVLRWFAGLEPEGMAVLSRRGLVMLDRAGAPAPLFPGIDEIEGIRNALEGIPFPGGSLSP